VRRFVTLALSLSLLLGLSAAGLVAQDEAKKEQAKTETKKDEPKKEEAKKDAPKADQPLPPIPPEVEAKRAAAIKAVAELIVASQDAGLIETTIDPPPVLDLLITGRATDARTLKGKSDSAPEVGLNPEVFGAWFTGYGKMDGVTPEKNVRIMQPSKGLQDWYDRRANVLRAQIAEIRKAKGEPAAKAEPKKDEAKKDEPKKDEPKKDEVKKEEPKKEEPKKDEVKKEEPKKEEPKKEGDK
jgi:hypothetical protein